MNEQYKIVLDNLCQNVYLKGKNKQILTNVNLTVNSGEFVAIVGCSGAGKTTLMNILSGYNKPSSGHLYIDGMDLHKNEDYFKGKVAYVPQQEILDKTLTLYKSLDYSLSLRVKGLSKTERKRIVNQVLKTVELYHVRNVVIKNLSGGEKKRASIATEMLSDPNIFLLDEPTSGLDANIEKKLMKKLRSIADTGKTIIITAHTISNLDLCDKIVFMGRDGKVCYYGPYKDAINYFKVNEFVDIYDMLKEDTNTWYKLYNSSNTLEYIEKRDCPKTDKKNRVNFFKQTNILVRRYVSSLLNNKFMLLLLLGQAVLMGVLICVAIEQDSFTDPRFASMLGIAFTLASIWLGLFNTIQEIVKERDILKKEYKSGLNYSSYIVSKIVVFSVLCLYQAIACISIVYFYLDPRPENVLLTKPLFDLIIMFFLIAFSTSVIGLFISSIVKEVKTTLILSPLYMMIQMLFSGMFIPFIGITENISYFIIARWGYEGFGTILDLKSVGVLEFKEGVFDFTQNHIIMVWMIAIMMSIIILFASIILIHYNVLSKEYHVLVLDDNKSKMYKRKIKK